MTPIRPLRSYRVRLVPADLPADQVEHAARCGQLPMVQLRAPSATWAERSARAVTGRRVYDVTRLEPADSTPPPPPTTAPLPQRAAHPITHTAAHGDAYPCTP